MLSEGQEVHKTRGAEGVQPHGVDRAGTSRKSVLRLPSPIPLWAL